MGFMVQGCWYEVVGCELEGAIRLQVRVLLTLMRVGGSY